MQELNNNYVKRGGHNVPCGIHINLLNFNFVLSKSTASTLDCTKTGFLNQYFLH